MEKLYTLSTVINSILTDSLIMCKNRTMLGTQTCTVGHNHSDQWLAHKGVWLFGWLNGSDVRSLYEFGRLIYFSPRVGTMTKEF